jgi:hypothetical protein
MARRQRAVDGVGTYGPAEGVNDHYSGTMISLRGLFISSTHSFVNGPTAASNSLSVRVIASVASLECWVACSAASCCGSKFPYFLTSGRYHSIVKLATSSHLNLAGGK